MPIFLLLLATCSVAEKFPPRGDQIPGPTAVAVADDGKHFYVVSSDFDRTYNGGVLVVLDDNAKRLNTVEVPRLARSMSVGGDSLLLTFGRDSDKDSSSVELYSLTEPQAPSLRHSWKIGCQPLNSTIVKDYRYFVVTCNNGDLYVGDRQELTLQRVRSYGQARRAIYLDVERQLLLTFVSEIDNQKYRDLTMTDRLTYRDGEEIVGANEIPDDWEERRVRQQKKRLYQYTVYDLKAAAEAGFPFQEQEQEFRWLYYSFAETDGDKKVYRTNFWDTYPDPDSGDSFYLSQRDIDRSSNNILRVTITGELRVSDGKTPKTSDVLQIETVHTAESDDEFPGDIAVERVNGRKVLLVNNFRDFINWQRHEVFFGITAFTLNEPHWQKSFTSSRADQSYYQFALNKQGLVVVSAFYGHKVFALRLTPDDDFVVDEVLP